ncbi:MAG TPA: YegS/Rv2252/BmrU family lipid kinase [Gemmatimonadaceae bacterium]|nr:YegS/Rv2252/BmrU family lipid kinase [Gemmatimonadaceae bacterium]
MIIHGARADREDVRHLVSWVRDKGHLVEVCATLEAGQASTFAAEAARRGVDVVVAAGGDGTLNEVINGLDGFDVPLGIIPVGTANDFARQVGVPADADHAMDVILQRKPRRLDTASLNGRRFLNVSTGGVGAEATAETPADVKERLGPMAYAISGMRKFAELNRRMASFSGDGFSYSGEFLMFAVGLTRSSGGGTMVTPMASATDGLLDLCVVEGMSHGDFARTMLHVRKGEHIGLDGVHYVQLKAVTIAAAEPIPVNVDGEVSNAARLVYRARARDLWVHVVRLPGEDED